ncbi:unnamed protein product [Cyclocybe aegerita]|uniref:lytic cellulose monooxygenase (C4-dehydrogenating) n=1 Tax=Cyclocybe aegerita TaxID=1973307 RepID=A0A8S0WGM7_CYCAE|nr:unnamed protein product [Cyclocybe aegerita]
MPLHSFPFFPIIYLLSVLRLALAHGFVHSVVVGGQTYPGWNPFSDPYTSGPPKIVRKIGSDGPVSNTDADIACHHGGNDGTAAIASASAGSEVTFQWAYWPGDHQGPVSTYMTSCSGDCSNFGANDARWFKIDASGYDPSTRQWAAAKLIANGMSWTSTIPVNLAPGQYLMRHEIIALHSSPAQFYPSCSQVEVTGSGTDTPSDSALISMQDLYTGVTFPNIYGESVSFAIPGPSPVSFDGNGGSASTPTTNNTSSNTSTRASTSTSTVSRTVPDAVSTVVSQPSVQCHLGSKRLIRQRSG